MEFVVPLLQVPRTQRRVLQASARHVRLCPQRSADALVVGGVGLRIPTAAIVHRVAVVGK
jgi:hypothetical protein